MRLRRGNAYRETAYDCDPPRQRNDNGYEAGPQN